jgi:hypothetical protein
MTRYSSATLDEHGVADACRSAARKLSSRPESGAASGRTRLDSAVANLLEAIVRALGKGRNSVPDDIQRAALRVARQVQVDPEHRPRGMHPARAGRYPVQPDMGWGAARGEAVPFATSLRLGRMG